MNDFFAVAAAATPAGALPGSPVATAGEEQSLTGEFADCLAESLQQQPAVEGEAAEHSPDEQTADDQANSLSDAGPQPIAAEPMVTGFLVPGQQAELVSGTRAEGQAEGVIPRAPEGAAPVTQQIPAEHAGAPQLIEANATKVDLPISQSPVGQEGQKGQEVAIEVAGTAPIATETNSASRAAPERIAASQLDHAVPATSETGPEPSKEIEKASAKSPVAEAIKDIQAAIVKGNPAPDSMPASSRVSNSSATRAGSSGSGESDTGKAATPHPTVTASAESQVKAHVTIEQQFAAQMERARAGIESPAIKAAPGLAAAEAPVAANLTVTSGTTSPSAAPVTVHGSATPPANAQLSAAAPPAPPAPSAPALPFSVASHAGLRGEAMRLVGQLKAAGKGASEATLLLHPKNLGSVHVRMELVGDKISASMMVETRGAEQAMQAALPHLDQAFRAQGFNEVRMLVSAGNPEYSWSQQANSGNGHAGSQPDRNASATQQAGIAQSVSDSQAHETARPVSASGRLNIVV